ncbi:inhibitor of host transcription [Vibrio phage F86]
MNAQNMTNEQIAAHFDMTVDTTGMPYAYDAKGRRHFITDLRTRVRKEATKKKARKVAAEKAPKVSAEELLAELQVSSDDAWAIRESQPGFDVESLGMNVYITAGYEDKHRLMIRSSVVTLKEIEREFGHMRINSQKEAVHRNKATMIVSGLSVKEIVDTIEQFKVLSN